MIPTEIAPEGVRGVTQYTPRGDELEAIRTPDGLVCIKAFGRWTAYASGPIVSRFREKVPCPSCGKQFVLREDGQIRQHKVKRSDMQVCPGSRVEGGR